MNARICAVLIAFLASALPALAQSAAQQAASQFRTAERAEAALYEEPAANRSRADYLKVIRSYERVYLITPHTAFADNALTSIARLYEAMSDPKNAVKTLQFLLHEYPQTPFRDVAVRDIARLNAPSTGNGTKTGNGTAEVVATDPTSVENIRFWTESRSIKVVVDVAGAVTFREGEAKSPQRYFVDISPARLNSSLTSKEWTVDSKAIQKIRVAQFDDSTVRVVLDGPTTRDVTTSNLKDPNRIVMDVSVPGAPPVPVTPPAFKSHHERGTFNASGCPGHSSAFNGQGGTCARSGRLIACRCGHSGCARRACGNTRSCPTGPEPRGHRSKTDEPGRSIADPKSGAEALPRGYRRRSRRS
jgi:hypothetical protein